MIPFNLFHVWKFFSILFLRGNLTRSNTFILDDVVSVTRFTKWWSWFAYFIIFRVLFFCNLRFKRYNVWSLIITLRSYHLFHCAAIKTLSHCWHIFLLGGFFFLCALFFVLIFGKCFFVIIGFLACISRLLSRSEWISVSRKRLLLLEMVKINIRCILLMIGSLSTVEF